MVPYIKVPCIKQKKTQMLFMNNRVNCVEENIAYRTTELITIMQKTRNVVQNLPAIINLEIIFD